MCPPTQCHKVPFANNSIQVRTPTHGNPSTAAVWQLDDLYGACKHWTLSMLVVQHAEGVDDAVDHHAPAVSW